MNEYEIQVMALIALGTGITMLFIVMELTLQAYWKITGWWRNRR